MTTKLQHLLRLSLSLIVLMSLSVTTLDARKNPTQIHNNGEKKIEKVRKKGQKRINKIRKRANSHFVSQLERGWSDVEPIDPPMVPEINPEPVVAPDQDNEPLPEPVDIPVTPVEVSPEPHPIPPTPITPIPSPPVSPDPAQTIDILLWSKTYSLMQPDAYSMPNAAPASIAAYWEAISEDADYEDYLSGLTSIGQLGNFGSWGQMMIDYYAAKQVVGGHNESEVLIAWCLAQQGYDVRLCICADNRVYCVFACQYTLLNTYKNASLGQRGWFKSIREGNTQYYILNPDAPFGTCSICSARFENSAPISPKHSVLPDLGRSVAKQRTLNSSRYGISIALSLDDEPLMKYYEDCPRYMTGDKDNTVWKHYAEAPFGNVYREQIIERFKRLIAGHSQYEAVDMILNFMHSAFVYEFDDKVWGMDRPFFPDETLYYPYCDCEDRAIFFTRLIKEVLGLRTALIYYPGHLAAAVEFTTDVKGDYIVMDGHKFTICDPTYINSRIGMTMPKMNNATCEAIVL